MHNLPFYQVEFYYYVCVTWHTWCFIHKFIGFCLFCSDVVVFKMADEDRHVLVDHQEENEDGDGQDTVVSSRHRRYS